MKTKIHLFLEKWLSGDTLSYRQIFAIILPLLVDQAFITSLSLINTMMISNVGVSAISAVSTIDQLNTFIMNVFIAVATGGTVIIAQYRGVHNDEMASRSASSALSAVGVLSLFVAVLMIGMKVPIQHLLFNPDDTETIANAGIYLIGCAVSYPFFGIFEAICGALRGVGNTKSSMMLSIIMNVTYVLLNLLFINVFKMGVLGMVLSLNIARFIGVAVGLVFLLKGNSSILVKLRDVFKLDFSNQKKILYIGLPFAAEQMFFNGGKLLTQTFISTKMGDLAVQTNAIAISINLLTQIVANSLVLAMITVVGQCIGRRAVGDARKYIKAFIVMTSLSFVGAAVIILPFFPLIIKLFSPPEEIIGIVFHLQLLTIFTQPFLWALSFVLPSAFRAAGDSKFTSITSMLTMWLFRVVLGYILGITFKMGIMGVWIAMCAEWGVRGLIFSLRYRGGKWHSHILIEEK